MWTVELGYWICHAGLANGLGGGGCESGIHDESFAGRALSPSGYEEISRAHLLEPTNRDAGRKVVWSHPAFANKSVFLRNDWELIRVDLSAP